MMLLIDEAQLFPRPCYTHVEKAPRLAQRPVTLFVAPVRDIAIIDTKQDDSVEFAALGAVESAQGHAASSLSDLLLEVAPRGPSEGHLLRKRYAFRRKADVSLDFPLLQAQYGHAF